MILTELSLKMIVLWRGIYLFIQWFAHKWLYGYTSPGGMCRPDIPCVSYYRENGKNTEGLHRPSGLQCRPCLGPYVSLRRPLFGQCALVTHWLRPGGHSMPVLRWEFPLKEVCIPTVNDWVEEWSEPFTGRWGLFFSLRGQNIVVGPGFWSTEIPYSPFFVALSRAILEGP